MQTLEVQSPFLPLSPAIVSSVNVNVGKYVNPSDVLFELVNTGDLHLALTVFEKDLPNIHPGQQVAGIPHKRYYQNVSCRSNTCR